jgi:rare lipoprotein A
MPRLKPRAFVLALLGACAAANLAAAEPAAITFAGRDGPLNLMGGGANSYGYGAQGRREGAVIDLRRPSNASAAPAAPAPPPEQGASTPPPWQERERVGPPYEANGRWYVPTAEPGYAQNGIASWYGPRFHGQPTASGEIYDQEALTAAHPTLPLNSLVQVTNLQNGREIIVRVNDRGPFAHERLIDLSRAGAAHLGFEQAGQARVHVRYLGPAPRRVTAASAALASATNVDDGAGVNPPGPAAPNPRLLEVGEDNEAGFVVQVGAFSDPRNAQRVRDAVASAGPAQIDVREGARGELFRVRVGPWTSRSEAEAALQTLVAQGYSQSIVASR